MDKELIQNDLRKIMSENSDLRERIQKEKWSVSYNKRADMVLMGGKFPVGSYYVPADEDGVLLRVDKNKKVCGFAIENAKSFVKKNPNGLGFVIYIIVYPYRSLFVILPLLFMAYQASKIKSILSVSDYIAGKTAYAA